MENFWVRSTLGIFGIIIGIPMFFHVFEVVVKWWQDPSGFKGF